MTKRNKSRFWNFVDHLEGDKVVWMVALLLMMFSIVAIFSSTTLLAVQTGKTRMDIISSQIFFSAFGLGIIILLYNFRDLKLIRFFSKYAFLICVLMLGFLATHADIKVLKAEYINQAWRTISIFGKFQFHVFEFTKIAMVMYLSWAIDGMNDKKLNLAKSLSKLPKMQWLDSDFGKKLVYIYAPIVITVLLVFLGSVSSGLFIGGIMVITILVGGVNIKELILPGFVGVVLIVGTVWGGYTLSDGKMFNRIATAPSRIFGEDNLKILQDHKDDKSSKAFTDAADRARQPIGAEIAIKEGGLFGKGPGFSTQKYVVPVMFEDYMYSFIVEEYGLAGGIIIIILYVSLLARGAAIVRNCKTTYEKSVVAGLTILISGQAFMHMLINTRIFPLTGQTLPLVSHGTSSFLMFCVAFGLILCISRVAKKQMDLENERIMEAGPLTLNARIDEEEEEEPVQRDEVRDTISDVEEIENQFND